MLSKKDKLILEVLNETIKRRLKGSGYKLINTQIQQFNNPKNIIFQALLTKIPRHQIDKEV